eukprot:SAG31_NODE_68_length_28153_cov_23.647717_3_plen_257_part_00
MSMIAYFGPTCVSHFRFGGSNRCGCCQQCPPTLTKLPTPHSLNYNRSVLLKPSFFLVSFCLSNSLLHRSTNEQLQFLLCKIAHSTFSSAPSCLCVDGRAASSTENKSKLQSFRCCDTASPLPPPSSLQTHCCQHESPESEPTPLKHVCNCPIASLDFHHCGQLSSCTQLSCSPLSVCRFDLILLRLLGCSNCCRLLSFCPELCPTYKRTVSSTCGPTAPSTLDPCCRSFSSNSFCCLVPSSICPTLPKRRASICCC